MHISAYIWLALLILFVVAEGASVSLVSIWFAAGALAAVIAALLGASTVVQTVLFLVVSVASSDGLIQLSALGSGVLRVSARELEEEVRRAREEMKKYY